MCTLLLGVLISCICWPLYLVPDTCFISISYRVYRYMALKCWVLGFLLLLLRQCDFDIHLSLNKKWPKIAPDLQMML